MVTIWYKLIYLILPTCMCELLCLGHLPPPTYSPGYFPMDIFSRHFYQDTSPPRTLYVAFWITYIVTYYATYCVIIKFLIMLTVYFFNISLVKNYWVDGIYLCGLIPAWESLSKYPLMCLMFKKKGKTF